MFGCSKIFTERDTEGEIHVLDMKLKLFDHQFFFKAMTPSVILGRGIPSGWCDDVIDPFFMTSFGK